MKFNMYLRCQNCYFMILLSQILQNSYWITLILEDCMDVPYEHALKWTVIHKATPINILLLTGGQIFTNHRYQMQFSTRVLLICHTAVLHVSWIISYKRNATERKYYTWYKFPYTFRNSISSSLIVMVIKVVYTLFLWLQYKHRFLRILCSKITEI